MEVELQNVGEDGTMEVLSIQVDGAARRCIHNKNFAKIYLLLCILMLLVSSFLIVWVSFLDCPNPIFCS